MHISAQKFTYIFLTSLLIQNVCFAYDFDPETTKCLKEANGSYSEIYNCNYQEKIRYINQEQRLIQCLTQISTPKERNLITQNQKLLEEYLISLNKGEIKILNDTNGLMYQTFAQGILSNIYLTNNQILEILSTGKTPKRNISVSTISAKTIEAKISRNLQLLKKELNQEQYQAILQSQTAWKNYKLDIEKNILPLIKNNLETPIYIKRLVLENRNNALANIVEISK